MRKRMHAMISNNNERGASILEFAIVLPILLVLLFGVIEFGFILYNKAMLTNAVREGARYGIVSPDTLASSTEPRTVAEITTVVTDYCTARLINFGGAVPPTVTVTPNTSDGTTASAVFGDDLTVSADYSYDFMFVSNIIGLPPTLTLHASIWMRYE